MIFCVTVFSGTIIARILKLGIRKDNELLFCGIENRTPCSYSSLYLSIFLSFTAKFVSQFVYICKMSDCIVGLSLRVMGLIFLFSSIFLPFPKLQVNIKKLC